MYIRFYSKMDTSLLEFALTTSEYKRFDIFSNVSNTKNNVTFWRILSTRFTATRYQTGIRKCNVTNGNFVRTDWMLDGMSDVVFFVRKWGVTYSQLGYLSFTFQLGGKRPTEKCAWSLFGVFWNVLIVKKIIVYNIYKIVGQEPRCTVALTHNTTISVSKHLPPL